MLKMIFIHKRNWYYQIFWLIYRSKKLEARTNLCIFITPNKSSKIYFSSIFFLSFFWIFFPCNKRIKIKSFSFVYKWKKNINLQCTISDTYFSAYFIKIYTWRKYKLAVHKFPRNGNWIKAEFLIHPTWTQIVYPHEDNKEDFVRNETNSHTYGDLPRHGN